MSEFLLIAGAATAVALLAFYMAVPRVRAALATPLGAGLLGGLGGALIATGVFTVMLHDAETRMIETMKRFINMASRSAIAELSHETEATLMALADAEAELRSAAAVTPSTLPPGAVVAFALTDGCPEGWVRFDPASDQWAMIGTADPTVEPADSEVGRGPAAGAMGFCRKT